VKPKMVFLSNATEYGTVYTRKELEEIREACTENGLYLYLDGARIANALCAQGNDLTLAKIAELADLFYIGGTKNGALLGEAMVINHPDLKPDFRYLIKQHCSMLAKGRIIGVQFLRLFEDGLYLKNADNANRMAQKLKKILSENGFRMYIDSPTNQIFPILDNSLIEKLREDYGFLTWAKYDEDKTVIRLVCSWATKEEAVREFGEKLTAYIKEK
ncbi:MAG: threonine aldolase, partial [Erysipelotrichaceae bacterium]|nr:threonine aldolase [Erysipelotrichaceae bacterium]